MAAPALVLDFIMLLTAREPPRGGCEAELAGVYADGASYSERISWAKVRTLLRAPSNWLIVVQVCGVVCWGCVVCCVGFV